MAVKLPQKFPGMTHATFVSSGNGTEVFSTNAPSGNRYFHFLVQIWGLHFKEYTSKMTLWMTLKYSTVLQRFLPLYPSLSDSHIMSKNSHL